MQTDATLAGATVAVVDDDPQAIEAMRELFMAWGAEVAGGCDAGEALRSLGKLERYPDLIVADLRLDHGGCGLDAVAQLRDELGMRSPRWWSPGTSRPRPRAACAPRGSRCSPKPVVPAALAGAASVLLAHRTNDHAGAQPHGLGAIPVLR